MRKLCVELEVSWLCWSEVKLNHILKTEDDKSFKDSLAKKKINSDTENKNKQ